MERSTLELFERLDKDGDERLHVERGFFRSTNDLSVLGVGESDSDRFVEEEDAVV